MKRTYTITISPALVAPHLCWQWRVECVAINDVVGLAHGYGILATGHTSTIHGAAEAAGTEAGRAEAALLDGQDVA